MAGTLEAMNREKIRTLNLAKIQLEMTINMNHNDI